MSATDSGLVTAVWRRRCAVRLDDGRAAVCVMRGRNLGLACGDRVRVALAAEDHGVVEGIDARSSLFFRSDAHREKLIAANVTQLLGIVAPEPRYDDELVQRWTIAAESAHCSFVLVANKSDLPSFASLAPRLGAVRALGYRVVELCAKRDVAALAPIVAGHRSALVGQSGMGKSTLINALAPGAAARTGELSSALGTGRHTTSETTLYPLDPSGWLVDSPGMKAFGLAHLDADAITEAFVELRPLSGRCRFRDCRHLAEPGCAVRDAVARGEVKPWRVALLQRLLAECERRERR